MKFQHLFLMLYAVLSNAQTLKTKVSAKEREAQFKESGTKRATTDFNNKVYILQTLGQNNDKEFDPFLIKTAKEKYNIRLTESPCVIMGDIRHYAKAMRKKVLAKFGSDIEAKIKTEALLDFKKSELYKNTIQPKIDTGFVFTWAHLKPEFPNGENAQREFLKEHIRDLENTTQWHENVTVVIEKDGSLSDIRFYKELKEDVKNEIIRVLNLMPKWTPARYYEENVRFKQGLYLSSKKEMEMMEEIKRKKSR